MQRCRDECRRDAHSFQPLEIVPVADTAGSDDIPIARTELDLG